MLWIQILSSGIAQGCVYGLVALGFVLIYKATETVNFAQGELMMLGAFLTYGGMAGLHLPFAAAVLLAAVGMGLAGLLIERMVIRPLLGERALSIVMLTFGIGYIARGGVTMIPGVGTDTHALEVPYRGLSLRLGGVTLAAEQLAIVTGTAALCLLLWAGFRFTKIGVAMQAASQNQLAASYMGIPVARLNSLVWALAAVLATLAGVLLAPLTFVHANMGFVGLKAVSAAIVGGFSSLPGAIVGGLVIGVAEALSGFYLPEGYKDVMPYAVVLLMLALRPTGLFGKHARKKV